MLTMRSISLTTMIMNYTKENSKYQEDNTLSIYSKKNKQAYMHLI